MNTKPEFHSQTQTGSHDVPVATATANPSPGGPNDAELNSQSDRSLPSGLAMDAVTLRVGDLDGMTDYYANSLQLQPIEEKVIGGEVRRTLGRADTPLLRLVHTPDLPGVNPRAARLGLGDVAIAVPTRADLDALVGRLRRARTQFADLGDAVVVHDPWGTQVTVALAGASPDRVLTR